MWCTESVRLRYIGGVRIYLCLYIFERHARRSTLLEFLHVDICYISLVSPFVISSSKDTCTRRRVAVLDIWRKKVRITSFHAERTLMHKAKGPRKAYGVYKSKKRPSSDD